MRQTYTCRRDDCGTAITVEDIGHLIAEVRAHVAEVHHEHPSAFVLRQDVLRNRVTGTPES